MDGETLRIGVLTPHRAAGPEEELPTMVPGRLTTLVARVSTAEVTVNLVGAAPAPVAARGLTDPPLLDNAAETLAAASTDVIGYASTSTGYAIGFDGEASMVARLSRRAGVPVAATCTSAVLALRVLNAGRIALINPPWFDEELNRLGAEYFRSQGVEVTFAGSAGLGQDPRRIEPAAVVEWTAQHVPHNADAVYIGGNGFRSAAAIEPLETRLRRPVLTSNQALLWSLLAHAGATFPVTGYGQLFTHRHPT